MKFQTYDIMIRHIVGLDIEKIILSELEVVLQFYFIFFTFIPVLKDSDILLWKI